MRGLPLFDTDQFIADCRAAVAEQDSHLAVKELVARAVSDPASVLKDLGEPTEAGVNKLFVSNKLTALNLIWGPMMTLKPHDHKMWEVIGIYMGREDNIFWRKTKDDPVGHIEAANAKAIGAGDCAPLGKDVVHSVSDSIPRLTEQPFNMQGNIQLLEESNTRLSAV